MIRPLTEADVGAFIALRREALAGEPMSFAASEHDDIASDPEKVREQVRGGPDNVILGAFDGSLVGIVGLYRDRHRKMAHKAHVWGMYVTPGHRRRGVARQLLGAAVAHARSVEGIDWIHLSVSSTTPAARRLYESAGFVVWGDEPDALRHDRRSARELHLALELAARRPR